MSFSFKVVDGDLSVSSGRLEVVRGLDKLTQDLTLWLVERYGDDRFHPNYGSTLDYYIGGVIEQDTQVRVQSEVFRVLQNYQQLQLQRFRERPEKFTPDELLSSIQGVTARIEYDRVMVTISFRNVAGATVSTDVGVTP